MRFLLTFVLYFGLVSAALAAGHASMGLTILTVGGDLPDPSAPGADPDASDLQGHFGVEFAYALATLDTQSLTADPQGNGAQTFTGPLLLDVMTTAGAAGKTAFPMGRDRYQPDISWDFVTQHIPQSCPIASSRPQRTHTSGS